MSDMSSPPNHESLYLSKDGKAKEGLGSEGVSHLAEAEETDEDNQTELHCAASSKSLHVGKSNTQDRNLNLHFG